jgi:HD-GYP domain-containing protein (c-di-GMP phosphodiesterase class II)
MMKQHAQYAYDMLYNIEYLRDALDIPYSHHERWDGNGYPRQLKNIHIPRSARIFAVIDVWDALSSDRPYRNAWSRDKVIEHIRSEAGKHFDPDIVTVFLEMVENGEI